MNKMEKIKLLAPKDNRTTIEVMTGESHLCEKDYVVKYEVPRESVENVGWGAVNVAEYLVHLSIAGSLPTPIQPGWVMLLGGNSYMFVSEAFHDSSQAVEYRPLPSWDKFGIICLGTV